MKPPKYGHLYILERMQSPLCYSVRLKLETQSVKRPLKQGVGSEWWGSTVYENSTINSNQG